MSLPDVVDGFVRVLTAGGLRATSHPGNINAPCVVVDFWEGADLTVATSGDRNYVVPLMVVISLADARTARQEAESMIGRIVEIIEADPTLDGGCDSSAPIDATRPVVQDLQGVDYLTFDVRVNVYD